MVDLTGRVVLITGASGGLGEGVTQAFLTAGATVAGVARSWRGKTPKGDFRGVEADLSMPQACRDVVEQVLREANRIDAVLHLMGGFAGGQPIQNIDDATWNSMISMNLSAAFYVFRAVLPALLAQGHGRLVAIGSRAGVEPGASLAAYNVSKAGLNALVKTAAAEVNGTGVTVNAVLPSTIDTPSNRQAMPQADFTKWVTPASIASLLLWLTSDESRDVNGALIPIYGQA
jgi:NAD(P)-dependent dehydrogenase (short-subunit alcohol dehydrogenase family)